MPINFAPLNAQQWQAAQAYLTSDLLFLVGQAGTGKTHAALALALQDVTALDSTRKKIVVCRPAVESGERLGSLPGNVEAKIGPFLLPVFDCVTKLAAPSSPKNILKLVEIAPLAYMRGRTFSDCVIILDEAQNCSWLQLKMFLTRMGTNSKVLVCGDPQQSDLPRGRGLPEVVDLLRDLPGVAAIHFDVSSCLRHPLVVEILRRM